MKILAIGAHADDVELGCGGTLIKAINHNHEVFVICLSDSENTDIYGEIDRTKSLARLEMSLALKKLNVKNFCIGCFPSKDVSDSSDVVTFLEQHMLKFKPDLILTQWIADTHQSHRNTGLATISAARNFGNILMYEPFPPASRSYTAFRPQVYIDITENINDKIIALKQYKSQIKKYGKEWIDSIKGRAKLRGYEMGKKYAEVFELVRYDLFL